MPVRLFVGNLPYDVTEAELRTHFSAAGAVTYVSLPTDRETGRQRGFAFVEFSDRAQAEEAIRRFNNQAFKGRPLAVSEARERDDRSRPSGPARPASSRSDAPARPAFSRPDAATGSEPAAPQAPSSKPNRNFGPDAEASRKRGKTKGGPRSERAPKGPMREMVRGQFFGGSEDEDEDDFYDDELNGEDFAEHEDEPEGADDNYQPQTKNED